MNLGGRAKVRNLDNKKIKMVIDWMFSSSLKKKCDAFCILTKSLKNTNLSLVVFLQSME